MDDYGEPIDSTCTVDFLKDPDETADYVINWAAELGADTIASSTFTAGGLQASNTSFDDTTATIWLSGGVCGQIYKITNRIVSAGGRIKDKTIRIQIRES